MKIKIISCYILGLILICCSSVQASNALSWVYKSKSPISGIAADSNGNIYVNAKRKFVALDSNGAVKWTKKETEYLNYKQPAVDSSGNVLISLKLNELYSLSPNGHVNWTFKLSGEATTYRPVINSEDVVYISAADTIYSLNSDGTLRWKFDTSEYGDLRIKFVTQHGNIIAQGAYYRTVIFSPDGKVELDTRELESCVAIGKGDTIYTETDSKLTAVDVKKKLFLWQASSKIESLPSIGSDGNSYYTVDETPFSAPLGTYYRYLKAVGPDGVEKWKVKIPDELTDAAPVVDGSGNIYIVTMHGRVFGVLPTGKIFWEEKIDSVYTSEYSMMLSPKGLCITDGRSLFVFKKQLPLSDSPWPSERGGYRYAGSPAKEPVS